MSMRNSLIARFGHIEPSEVMYRRMTVDQARMYREGKTKPDDSAIDPIIRDAAKAYNRRWFLFIPFLRLPKIGHFAKEVESRSNPE